MLVTGATGFIGGRVVERLILEHGAEVVALVHRFQNASRLARFPLRMVGGDVADAARVTEAATGCDAIIHCAMGTSGSWTEKQHTTVEGARNMCAAAQSHRAKLVYLSTFSVYGVTAPGPLDENSPKDPAKDPYGRSKLAAEQLVQRFQDEGADVTILQPTIVYGPWSYWSSHVIRQLTTGKVALPGLGSGLCNAVYVDDVVDAIFQSLQAESARGPYLISGPQPVTWREFYEVHAAGGLPCEIVDLAAADRDVPPAWKTWLRNHPSPRFREHFRGLLTTMPGVSRTYRHLKPYLQRGGNNVSRPVAGSKPAIRPVVMPSASHRELLASQTRVVCTAAESALGYRPRLGLQEAGSLTSAWSQWAGLVPERAASA